MTVMLICAAIIALYACIEAVFALALSGNTCAKSNQPEELYSMVVAARNEEKNIERCISSLLAQHIHPACIIVVDDHSEDSTAEILLRMASEHAEVRLIHCSNDETGKRAALLKGVSHSKTELVLTIDADCFAGPGWASALLKQSGPGVKMITGPVVVSGRGVLWLAEFVETMYLMSGGAGAAALGMSFQASGANLAFYKNDFGKFVESGSGSGFKSGDDVFFLQYIQKMYGRKSVVFSQNSEAVVRTNSHALLGAWLRQRARWVSKAAGYRRFDAFVAGLLMMASFAAGIVAAVYMFLVPDYIFYGLGCVMLKILGDFVLLVSAAMKWELRVRPLSFILFTPLYPAFLLAVGLTAIFGGKQSWKGRTIT